MAVRQLERVPMSRRLGLDRSQQERRLLLAEEFTRVRDRFSTAIDSAEFLYVHWPVPHPFGLEDPSSADRGAGTQLSRQPHGRGPAAGRCRGHAHSCGPMGSDHARRDLRPLAAHLVWEGSGAWTDEEQHATGGRQSPYVPFVVKFAGRHAPLLYDKPFTIALLYDVVLAIADGVVTNPSELAAWLDAHRGKHPTDVNAHRPARVAGS